MAIPAQGQRTSRPRLRVYHCGRKACDYEVTKEDREGEPCGGTIPKYSYSHGAYVDPCGRRLRLIGYVERKRGGEQ